MVKGRLTAVGTGTVMCINQEDVQIALKNCVSDVHDTKVDEAKNRKKLQRGSIRISDVEFGIGLEILGKIFLRKLFCI